MLKRPLIMGYNFTLSFKFKVQWKNLNNQAKQHPPTKAKIDSLIRNNNNNK